MCNIILTNFKHFNIFTLIVFFKCYVRLILEYVSVILSLHHMYLIDRIENFQCNYQTISKIILPEL